MTAIVTTRRDCHMDIMGHGRTYGPAVARTPGGADPPVAVDEWFPPLPPPAAGVTIGVVDTGLVLDGEGRPHPWFGDHVAFGEQDQDLLQQGAGAREGLGHLADADGHGTFVTGLILREAPSARVIMHGALDKREGDRLDKRDDELVAEAVRSLAHNPDVQVINLSFGGGEFTNRRVAAKLAKALEQLDGRVAVVAAAGNGASDRPVYPAAFDGVISVGALDERRLRPPGAAPAPAPFTNHGDWVSAYASGVQVLGPYVDFDETGSDGFGLRPPQHFRGWARWSGTSFAAATVSGRIAQTAIQRGITGAEAADVVLRDARRISDSAVWVQGTN